MVGIVSLREEFQFTAIDVEFMNKNFHRNLTLNDDFGISMAALNYAGLLMASKAQQQDMDDYEEDLDDEMVDEAAKRRKHSNIQFKALNEWKEVKDWNYQLPLGESVECLAIGSGWCAAYTSLNYFRIFSNDGIQKTIFCQATPVVTIAGYENLLAVVYHSGPSIYGCQALRLKVINMQTRNYKSFVDTEFPVSRQAVIVWMSFSDEGHLFSFDSEGVMRYFSFTSEQWMPVLDFKQRHAEIFAQLWIVGVSESEVLAIEMARNHQAPLIAQKNSIKTFQLKIPLLKQENEDIDSKELTRPQIEAKLMNA